MIRFLHFFCYISCYSLIFFYEAGRAVILIFEFLKNPDLKMELDDLVQRNTELEKENSFLKQENARLREENSRLRVEYAILRSWATSRIAQDDEQYASLLKSNTKLEKEVTELLSTQRALCRKIRVTQERASSDHYDGAKTDEE